MEKPKEEEQTNNRERHSLYESHAYTRGKFALMFVNEVLEKNNKGTPKEEICRKVGKYVIEVMDAIADENFNNDEYLALLTKGNDFLMGLTNAFRAKAVNPDPETAASAKIVSEMGMLLSAGALDFESETLPSEFLDMAWFAAYARPDEELHKLLITKDYKGLERRMKNGRLNGQIDPLNEAAWLASSALDHFEAGVKTEKHKGRKELHRRSFDTVKSMYNAMALDDPSPSSKRLFEDEKRLFLDGGNGSTKENRQWELYATMRKLNECVDVLGEASGLMKDIIKTGLIKGPGAHDKKPINTYLLFNVEFMYQLEEQIFGAATILINERFGPLANLYSEEDRLAIRGCEKEVGKLLLEASSLYNAQNAVWAEHKGKRVSEEEFKKVYDAMSKAHPTRATDGKEGK